MSLAHYKTLTYPQFLIYQMPASRRWSSAWELAAVTAQHKSAKRGRSYASRAPARMQKGRASSVKVIRKVVNKALKAKLEKKTGTAEGSNAPYAELWTAPIAANLELLPQITVGAGRNDRVGSRIQPTGCRLTVTLSSRIQNDSAGTPQPQPIMARILVAQQRDQLNASTAVYDFRTLLEGPGGNVTFDGTPSRLLYPPNVDGWEVFADELVTLQPYWYQVTSGTVVNSSPILNTQRTFVFDIKCPKFLTYASDSDAYPSNFNPTLMVGYADPNASATVPQLPNDMIVSISSCLLTYTDA